MTGRCGELGMRVLLFNHTTSDFGSTRWVHHTSTGSLQQAHVSIPPTDQRKVAEQTHPSPTTTTTPACYRRHAAAACCSLVCSSGQRNSKFLYYGLYIFLAGLVELEKENKFHYGVATRLLPVRTQSPPPCRGSPALSVGAWGA